MLVRPALCSKWQGGRLCQSFAGWLRFFGQIEQTELRENSIVKPIQVYLISKLAMLTLSVHYEPLNSNWP